MVLSDFVAIVQLEWHESFAIRRELILHEFILMPNHLHAIVEIWNGDDETGTQETLVGDGGPLLEAHGRVPLTTNDNESTPFPTKRNPPVRLPWSI